MTSPHSLSGSSSHSSSSSAPHAYSHHSKFQQASMALANLLEIDLEHIENQMMLNLNQAFGQSNKDWQSFIKQCEQRQESSKHLLSGDDVTADHYACTLCHKGFKLNRPDRLHLCHSCSGKEFYQANRIDGPIYLH